MELLNNNICFSPLGVKVTMHSIINLFLLLLLLHIRIGTSELHQGPYGTACPI